MNEQLIEVGAAPLTVGRDRSADFQLSHPTVSRKHAVLRKVDGHFQVEDLDSRYGTFVNGHRIRKATARPGDRVQFGTLQVFRVTKDGLLSDESAAGFSIQVRGLAISRDARVLVQDANVQVAADSFVGILGPSGAGKSTLLNAIATYLPSAAGDLSFGTGLSVQENLDEYRAGLGHVPQDDIVWGALTVRENLEFACQLRMGSVSQAEIDRLVNRALLLVGLAHHADKPTGKLSGGQRKRASVALELIKQPRLLLLDEPTSGLDPATEAHLMEQLRHIARQGTTVVCTTHLMENIGLFDSVIVMGVSRGVGRIAFVGPPKALLPHFGCQGFADLYERLAEGAFPALASVPQSPEPASETATAGIVSSLAPALSIPGVSFAPANQTESSSSASAALLPRQLVSILEGNAWQQFETLCRRGFQLVWRDRRLMLSLAVQPLALGVLICLTQFDESRLVVFTFLAIVLAVWLGLNNAARELVRERRHYIRERMGGLRPEIYLAAKVAVNAAIGAVQVALLILVLRFVGKLVPLQERPMEDQSSSSSVWQFGILFACYLGGMGLGFLLSTLAPSEGVAVAWIPLLIMPQLLISPVVTGHIEKVFSRSQDAAPFRPLFRKLSDPGLPRAGQLLDLASLACLPRPALLLAVPNRPFMPESASPHAWLLDLFHLVVLVTGVWMLTFVAFLHAEPRWLRLIGVGVG